MIDVHMAEIGAHDKYKLYLWGKVADVITPWLVAVFLLC